MATSSPALNNKRYRRAFIGIGLLLVVIVAALIVSGEARKVLRIISRTDLELYLPAALILLVCFTLLTTFWQQFLPVRVPYSKVVASSAVAMAISILTPMPDIPVRVAIVSRGTEVSATKTTTTMVLDKLLLQIMRLVTFIAAMIFVTYEEKGSPLSVIMGLALVGGALWMLLWIARHPQETLAKLYKLPGQDRISQSTRDKIGRASTTLVDSVQTTLSGRRLFLGLGLYALIWTSALLFQWLVLLAMPGHPSTELSLIVAAAVLVIRPPMTPAMIVIYQSVVVAVLAGLRILDGTEAIAYSILLHIPQVIAWLAIGAWGFRHVDFRFRELYETLAQEVGDRRPDEDSTETDPA